MSAFFFFNMDTAVSRTNASGLWEWQSHPPGLRLREGPSQLGVCESRQCVQVRVFMSHYWSVGVTPTNCCFLLPDVYSPSLLPCRQLLQRLADPFPCAVHRKHAEVLSPCCSWCHSTGMYNTPTLFQFSCTHICVPVLSSFLTTHSGFQNQASRDAGTFHGRVFPLQSLQWNPAETCLQVNLI